MVLVLISMLLYGFIHSILASQGFKQRIQNRVGDRAYHSFYRLAYNVFAVVSLVPVFLLLAFRPGETVWSIDLAYETPLLIIQAIGLIGLTISLLQIDLLRFAGISQMVAYFGGQPLPLPGEPLQTHGLYRFVRHPLYLFSLLTIWPITTMTSAYLGFCLGATTYFIIGSYYEEKRLMRLFGEAYERYQAKVPWVFPAPRSKS